MASIASSHQRKSVGSANSTGLSTSSSSRKQANIRKSTSGTNLVDNGNNNGGTGNGRLQKTRSKQFVAHTSGTRHHHRAFSSGNRVPSHGSKLNKLTAFTTTAAVPHKTEINEEHGDDAAVASDLKSKELQMSDGQLDASDETQTKPSTVKFTTGAEDDGEESDSSVDQGKTISRAEEVDKTTVAKSQLTHGLNAPNALSKATAAQPQLSTDAAIAQHLSSATGSQLDLSDPEARVLSTSTTSNRSSFPHPDAASNITSSRFLASPKDAAHSSYTSGSFHMSVDQTSSSPSRLPATSGFSANRSSSIPTSLSSTSLQPGSKAIAPLTPTLSRTQQKVLLQRQAVSSEDIVSPQSHGGPEAGPTSVVQGPMLKHQGPARYSHRLTKDLERIHREYDNAKRFQSPVSEAIRRLKDAGILELSSRPVSRPAPLERHKSHSRASGILDSASNLGGPRTRSVSGGAIKESSFKPLTSVTKGVPNRDSPEYEPRMHDLCEKLWHERLPDVVE